MNTEAKLYLTTRLCIYLGLLGLGLAAGSKVGFNIVHGVCVSHGWEGVLIVGGEPSVCTRAIIRLTRVMEIGGYTGAIALILGGSLDTYRDEVIAWME